MFKTRKNNLTMEDGHKLRNMIAGLSGPQQMTVIEILRENKEHLAQDEEGNVEMEFREFNQKSIDDLKSYVLSATTSNQKGASSNPPRPHAGGGKDLSGGGGVPPHPGGGKDNSGGNPGGGKDLSGAHNTTNDSEDSDSDDSSSSESSSDSDSD